MPGQKLILIVGRNAALAQDLDAMAWPATYSVRSVGAIEVGVLDIDRLRTNLERFAPSLIISTIGYNSPDRAERDRTITQARNHWAVADLAEAAGALGIPLIHLSSDQVFAGDRTGPYLETDQPDAISVFGQSQAAGEAEIRAHCHRHVILRTGWLFGVRGHNMLRTMLSLGRRGGRVHVPNDHVSGPTPARELCSALRQVGLQLLDDSTGHAGATIHFCGTPAATLYDFARGALSRAISFQVAPDLIPITPNRFGVTGAPARRTELDCSVAAARFGLVQPDWHSALADCVEEICQTEQASLRDLDPLVAQPGPVSYRSFQPEPSRRLVLPVGVSIGRRRTG